MATIFEDNFNSYTDGPLAGQGGWDWDTYITKQINVQGSLVKEGAKAVQGVFAAGAEGQVLKWGSIVTTGRITYYARRSSNSVGELNFKICDGGENILVYFDASGYIRYYNGSIRVDIQPYNANQWYQVEIEWRESDSRARYRIDGGSWTAWDTRGGTNNNLRMIKIYTWGASDDYIDYIAEYPLLGDVSRISSFFFNTALTSSRTSSFFFNSALTSISKITSTSFDIKNYLSKGMKMIFDIVGLTGAPSKIKAIVKEIKTRFRVKMK